MIDLIKAAKATAICSATALILSACHRGNPSDEATDTTGAATDVAPTPSDTASEGGEKISIFRPDVEIAREPKPMAPLSMRIGFDGGHVESHHPHPGLPEKRAVPEKTKDKLQDHGDQHRQVVDF